MTHVISGANNLYIYRYSYIYISKEFSSVTIHSAVLPKTSLYTVEKSSKCFLSAVNASRVQALWDGNGQEVRGCVFSPRLLGPHWLAVGAQTHEHVLLLVLPLCRGVRVVPVLLDPLYQLAVSAELLLENGKETRFEVTIFCENACQQNIHESIYKRHICIYLFN